MQIGIYKKDGSFSDGWIAYCERNNIPYKLVDVYANDIIAQLADCDIFMWHFHHADYRDVKFAKSLLISLENSGKKVFPNANTCWHFDDKIAQKYLLESISAPLVPTYVFYSKKEAKAWIETTTFPKVFKLKGGAGAMNVKLVKTKKQAVKFINRTFSIGFPQYDKLGYICDKLQKYIHKKGSFRSLLGSFYYAIKPYPTEFSRYQGNEKGYVYFQDFIPNNKFDIRICVVDGKAFGLKRLVRDNDFRASGSGSIIYDKSELDERCVQIAFDVNKKLKAQSVAFDFVFDEKDNPLIVEISYGYIAEAYRKCQGYWTENMLWHEGEGFDFCGWMVESLIRGLK
jgi:glutathione synthase/RimK-type ligase-like ATP-grasp enzyme